MWNELSPNGKRKEPLNSQASDRMINEMEMEEDEMMVDIIIIRVSVRHTDVCLVERDGVVLSTEEKEVSALPNGDRVNMLAWSDQSV